jgi:hypothetical protein
MNYYDDKIGECEMGVHVAHMGEMRNAYKKFGSDNLKVTDHLEHAGVHGRILLDCLK